MRALRIPGLIDIVRTSEPGEIVTLAQDPRLDRRYEGHGPLINRLILRRIRRVLRLGGKPLPPVAPASYPGRAEEQAALEAKLARLSPVADEETLEAIACYVGGSGSRREMRLMSQQAIGRLFSADYRATRGSWAAARVLSGSVRSFLSPRPWLWRITGRLDQSRALLAGLVEGDRSGLHATGIAVHNLVESVERMRRLTDVPDAFRRYTPGDAASLCIAAPATVVREARAAGTNAAASFRRGALVLLGLEKAREETLRRDMALMRGMWSECPAHQWLPALLAEVWRRAGERKHAEKR